MTNSRMHHHQDGRPGSQAGKILPLLLAGAAALAAGILLYSQTNSIGDGSADAQARAARLSTLQDSLTTSLALPLDFKSIPPFELIDVNAEPITETVFDNKWSLVFFGYTHCPDVCPITLQVMKNVVASMQNQGLQPPQIVFVSVDPVRDSSEVMKQYISYFNDDFIGITGDAARVHEMTRSLGIVASFTANDDDPDNYIVDHTASLLLIDPQRRLRAKVSPPHEADKIIADYLAISSAPS
ncbi:MAG: SCO family protein [Granulosicoccus sp.]|nr:SCO family protein [Granulosicoccus sp.]